MINASTQQLVASLRSFICPGCQGCKDQKKSFCGACFQLLSKDQQQALYRGIGQGYEKAFAEALLKIKHALEPSPKIGSLFSDSGPREGMGK